VWRCCVFFTFSRSVSDKSFELSNAPWAWAELRPAVEFAPSYWWSNGLPAARRVQIRWPFICPRRRCDHPRRRVESSRVLFYPWRFVVYDGRIVMRPDPLSYDRRVVAVDMNAIYSSDRQWIVLLTLSLRTITSTIESKGAFSSIERHAVPSFRSMYDGLNAQTTLVGRFSYGRFSDVLNPKLQHATCEKLHYNCNRTYTLQGNGRRHVPRLPIGDRVQSASGWYHRLDGTLWLATSCKFLHNIVHTQYYANEVCKPCGSLAGFLASFIV